VVPGALGYLGWGIIFSRMPASRAGSFLFLVPLFAILIAWLFLGEQPGFQSLVGGVLVLLGTALIQR
jgi:drug/metabolite transporter (DMT)-like permease